MVTIKDIAAKAGVSTATVSNVIHGKTQKVSSENIEKINRLLVEMGYERPVRLPLSAADVPSQFHLETLPSMIAVVVNTHSEFKDSLLAHPFYGKTISVIEARLRAFGYYMMLYSAENAENIFQAMMVCRVKGIIALSFSRRDCEKILQHTGCPVVSIDAYGEPPESTVRRQAYNISIDDVSGGYLMTRHLISCGYEHIIVCGTDDYGINALRLSGCERAIKETFPTSSSEAPALSFLPLGTTLTSKKRAFSSIIRCIRKKERLALFFLSDASALDAMNLLSREGFHAPEDFGIAGYDDIDYAGLSTPPLTTIHQDMAGKAAAAVDLLHRLLAQKETVSAKASHEILLPVALVRRESTAN